MSTRQQRYEKAKAQDHKRVLAWIPNKDWAAMAACFPPGTPASKILIELAKLGRDGILHDKLATSGKSQS